MSDLLHPIPHFLFLFLFCTSIAAQSTNYTNCPSLTCGHLTISYPFWKIGNQTSTQFCGYQGFGINCSSNGTHEIPTINLGTESYYVKNLNERGIALIDYDVEFPSTNDRPNCPRVRHRINVESLPLNFSTGNVNLSFHFNCTEIPTFARPIPCLDGPGRKSCVNMLTSKSESYDWDAWCEDEVVTTVFGAFLTGAIPSGMESLVALRYGFELNWQTVANCSKCETSDGRCGYNKNTTEVMCFCEDGTTTKDHCRKGTFLYNSD